jgi:hypothetical protein
MMMIMMCLRIMECISRTLACVKRLILQHHCSAKHHVFRGQALKLENAYTALSYIILRCDCWVIVIKDSMLLFIDFIEALDVLHSIFDNTSIVVVTSWFVFQRARTSLWIFNQYFISTHLLFMCGWWQGGEICVEYTLLWTINAACLLLKMGVESRSCFFEDSTLWSCRSLWVAINGKIVFYDLLLPQLNLVLSRSRMHSPSQFEFQIRE